MTKLAGTTFISIVPEHVSVPTVMVVTLALVQLNDGADKLEHVALVADMLVICAVVPYIVGQLNVLIVPLVHDIVGQLNDENAAEVPSNDAKCFSPLIVCSVLS